MKILHIISYPRSGSTILGLACAQYKEVTFLGEVSILFKYNWDRHCGCTAHEPTHVTKCPVWGPILTRIQAVFQKYNFWDKEEKCFTKKIRPLFLKKALKQLKNKKIGPELEATMEIIKIVFEESSQIEKAKVVVDNSKDIDYLQILNHCYENNYRALHLLRDPRGVVFSGRKNPSLVGKDIPLSLWRSSRIALGWSVKNFLIEKNLKNNRNEKHETILYENWCRNPKLITDRIMKNLLETDSLDSPFTDQATLKIESTHSHTFSGNRSRKSSGSITIKCDQSWKNKLKKSYRVATNIFSSPALKRYNYKVAIE